ncbi:unnamed protein product [Prunus armeniaca]
MADEEEGEEEKEAEMGVERRCWGWFSHLVMEVQKLVCFRGMNSVLRTRQLIVKSSMHADAVANNQDAGKKKCKSLLTNLGLSSTLPLKLCASLVNF